MDLRRCVGGVRHAPRLRPGLAGLRNALAESGESGGATARALRSARENYADVAPSPRAFDRIPDARGQDDMLQDAPVRRMLEPAIDDETQSVPSRLRMAPLPVGEDASEKPRKKGAARAVVRILLVLLLLGGLAGSLLVLWPTVSELYSSLRSSGPVEVASEPSGKTCQAACEGDAACCCGPGTRNCSGTPPSSDGGRNAPTRL